MAEDFLQFKHDDDSDDAIRYTAHDDEEDASLDDEESMSPDAEQYASPDDQVHTGSGVQLYRTPDDLFVKLELMYAAWAAGNKSTEIFNDVNEIMKELLKIGAITKNRYAKIQNLFLL